MAISLATLRTATSLKQGLARTDQIRTAIADYFGINVECLVDETNFVGDLGADSLDRLELIMVIEDQFALSEITDEDLDQIETIGDLIRLIEGDSRSGRDRQPRS